MSGGRKRHHAQGDQRNNSPVFRLHDPGAATPRRSILRQVETPSPL